MPEEDRTRKLAEGGFFWRIRCRLQNHSRPATERIRSAPRTQPTAIPTVLAVSLLDDDDDDADDVEDDVDWAAGVSDGTIGVNGIEGWAGVIFGVHGVYSNRPMVRLAPCSGTFKLTTIRPTV